MARRSNETATFFAQKKLLGKAHTSNLFTDAGESIGSAVQLSSTTVFGEAVPTSPTRTLNVQQGVASGVKTVEYVEFDLVAITDSFYDANSSGGGSGEESGESSQTAGYHAYAFRFKSTYELDTDDNRQKAGNGNFDNSKVLHETLGAVQLVPTNFSRELLNPYEVYLYESDGTQIPLLANIDWQVDTYNGIVFVQDYDANVVPSKARAFIYVGDMLSDVVTAAASSGGSGSGGGGREKQDYIVSSLTTSGSVFSIPQSSLQNSAFDKTLIDVFVNGQLLLSGTDSQVGTGDVDYFAYSSNQLKFGFDLNPSDVVSVSTYNSGSSSGTGDGADAAAGYLVVSATGSLDNERVITAGTGLQSDDAGAGGTFTIKVEKELVFNEVLGGNADGSNTYFTFANTPFATTDVSVFVNGQLQVPNDKTDYQDYSVTGSHLYFSTGSTPELGSLVMAIYNKVVS